MSEKPVIFISHASQDRQLALHVKKGLETAFQNVLQIDLDVFVSGGPDAIAIGENWFGTVINKLDSSVALIVLITASSINKPWIWFEVGYFWKRRQVTENLIIYPLYEPGVEIPSPLNILQGKCITDSDELTNFTDHLGEQIVSLIRLSRKKEFFKAALESTPHDGRRNTS